MLDNRKGIVGIIREDVDLLAMRLAALQRFQPLRQHFLQIHPVVHHARDVRAERLVAPNHGLNGLVAGHQPVVAHEPVGGTENLFQQNRVQVGAIRHMLIQNFLRVIREQYLSNVEDDGIHRVPRHGFVNIIKSAEHMIHLICHDTRFFAQKQAFSKRNFWCIIAIGKPLRNR